MDIAIFIKAGIALFAIVILAITARNIHVKLGDKEFSFQSREKIRKEVTTQTVKVVTEYADFKYALKEDRDRAVRDFGTKAKWCVSIGLDSYYQTVIEAMRKHGETSSRVIAIMTEGVRPRQTEFLLSIYEQNHLAEKTDEELKVLTEQRYPILGNIFRSYAQTYWIADFGNIEDLFFIFENGREKSKNALYTLLKQYRDLAQSKNRLYKKVEQLDTEVRDFVLVNGRLPPNAMQQAQDIHHDGL